jgi:DNA-binding CsgD family transcriptional regulator
MLLGRAPECERIERLVADARAGASGVLVVRGEPGIGKSVLLEHAAAVAGGATVLRVRGVESEVEVAFAGLSELLRPALGELGRLPAPQARALDVALGLAPAAAAEPQLVGAATLGLLAALAEQRPVVVLADDVHWLDRPSASALVFAARRLLVDAVAVALALRPGEAPAVEAAEFATLDLTGLDAGPARALLAAHAARPVAEDTAAWLHAATGGNPLALVDAAAEAPRLRPGPVGGHPAIGDRLARSVGRRLDALPEGAGDALLAAAVADAEDLEPVLAAVRTMAAAEGPDVAAAAGAGLAGLEAAEAAGLVTLAPGRVAFRHPLTRTVLLARAAPADRRAAHRAYAAALDADPERRAWHLAAGTLEPDEGVAGALAAAADAAASRGGHAAAAAALEQAARVTPESARKAERLRRAAEAAWLAGDGPRALALLDDAAPVPAAAPEQAEVAHLRGRVLARRGPVPLAVETLDRGAEAIASEDPAKAAEMLAEAAFASLYGPQPAADVERLGRRALALVPAGEPRARGLAASMLGGGLVMQGDAEASRWLDEAATLTETTPALRDDPRIAALVGVPAAFLRSGPDTYVPLARAIALARERGAVGALPIALFYLGVGMLASPRWAEAAAHFEEALRVAGEAGLRVDAVAALSGLTRLEARRGDPRAAEHARTALGLAREFGTPFFEAWALHAQGEIALGAGELDAAAKAFEAKAALLAEHGMRDPDLSPAPELVEIAGRTGPARTQAAEALAAAEAKGLPWALARAHRATALAEPDDDAALTAFEAALQDHGHDLYERARTQLLLGERLRRAGRRADAREPLRAALDAFDTLGAGPWAERARAELRATGETARRRDPSSLDELTPQELRIALMLAGGTTTRQAAAALYLSPKTVEYHLRNVYLKLGVNSRDALRAALRAGGAGPEAPGVGGATGVLPARR